MKLTCGAQFIELWDKKTSGLLDGKTEQFIPRTEIEFVGPHANWKAKYVANPEDGNAD